jgi:hypothetical protein
MFTWFIALYGAASALAVIVVLALCKAAGVFNVDPDDAAAGSDRSEQASVATIKSLVARIDHCLDNTAGPYAMIGVAELEEIRDKLRSRPNYPRPTIVPDQIAIAQQRLEIAFGSNAGRKN